MTIKNHKWAEAEYIPSPNKSGKIDPKFIVMHYTAGNTAESAINTLTRKGSNVSAQIVIDIDGTITQLVPFNVKAWHAGPSRHAGYNGLNKYSIGIELVNVGFLKKTDDGFFEDAYGEVKWWDETKLVKSRHPRVGGGTYYWPRYTKKQLKATYELTEALIAKYGIIDVVTHEEIDTRGWKTDPGPAFPMKMYKDLLSNRHDDSDKYQVTASVLNVRTGPGGEFGKIDALDKGTIIDVLDIRGDWARISEDGWVHAGYLRRV